MLSKLLKKKFLENLDGIRFGSLFLTLPDGSNHYIGGDAPGPHADLVIHQWSVVHQIACRGDVGFADSYRDGLWYTSDIENLFLFALKNEEVLEAYVQGNTLSRLLEQVGYLFRMNTLKGSRRNIQDHYDLGNEFYSLWLDSSMTYSSALYKKEEEHLESAQVNKYDRILDRIDDDKGSILEIGCGWGGFAERAIERSGRPLKGLTLSSEQLAFAKNRLGNNADFQLQDYRMEKGVYDNIVSIEMFEAVGIKYWKQYFDQISGLMRKGGKALIQSIFIEDDRFESYRKGSDTIRSYIFPGGMLPSDEKFTQAASASGLRVLDRFSFGNDYAKTLRDWLKRFDDSKAQILELGFDEPFIRLWRYYLASCAASFAYGRIGVMQYELVHA